MNVLRNQLKGAQFQRVVRRSMGGGHGHGDHGHGPHIPAGYNMIGKACLVATYLWIFYRLKQDNGQLFGFYKPWLHEHSHEHTHFVDNVGGMPELHEEEEEEDDDE